MSYFLETHDIEKSFANHKALNKVSISVPEGEIFGLLGPNGAGKTTLIRIINHITAPDSGTVIFNGEKLQAKHTEQIGYLPEERGLYKKMKVGEQAIYFAQLKGMPKKEAEIKLKKWFEKFEIEAWWNRKVEELSKGMQQKVQFIATILHQPKLLIFDEPFSGFDPVNAQLLKDEILDLKKNGSTIIFSTHNMSSVEEVCDNIALINNSQKVLSGKIDEIKRQFKLNIFEINFAENILPANPQRGIEILEQTKNRLKVKTEPDISNNQLLSYAQTLGQISAFNELVPSINDIFIKIVTGKNE